ncbi:MAG: imidazole glycerol phosphate synthase subunit HisH [Chitinophagales bacterium]|nr:imidazole glycerol phosphate synthase subunit HisH [Chitinophagales bacterium]
MNVAIIKYNAGNVQSVVHALHRLNIEPIITDNHETILQADKVIFPGVGHAQPTMQYLKERNLDVLIKNLKQPVLGICLGQQLMCQFSEEGNVDCLNIFPVQVKKFQATTNHQKIPHMGWNTITDLKSLLFQNIDNSAYVYFVHSYYCEISDYTIATTNYILPYASAMHKDNFYAVQFHPEKSEKIGSQIIENFIKIH